MQTNLYTVPRNDPVTNKILLIQQTFDLNIMFRVGAQHVLQPTSFHGSGVRETSFLDSPILLSSCPRKSPSLASPSQCPVVYDGYSQRKSPALLVKFLQQLIYQLQHIQVGQRTAETNACRSACPKNPGTTLTHLVIT